MKKFILSVLVIAMVFSLIGCGAKNEAPAEGESLKPITLVLDYVPNTNHTGIYVALENGYFKEEGLDVKVIQPPDEGAPLLVVSGGAEMGVDFQDLFAAALSQEEPLPLTAIGAIIQHNTSGILSLKGKGMDSPKGMEGKTYATWESPIELAIIKHVMEKDGGDFSKLNVVPYSITDTFAGLETDIDALWVYYAWDGVAAEVKGMEIDYFDFASIDPALDYYTPIFIANNNFLKDRPEDAKAMMKALKKGYEFSVEKPEEAAEILVKHVPELDKDLIVASQKYLADKYIDDATSWGYIDPERWDRFYGWLAEHELISNPIPAGFGFSNDYLEQ
ncbi:MAG: ABC transporter substrate-binding protein [Tissierellia bacterium]|nr:ABC transporter substrate-binding protein [Tissierellia bacterium]